MENIRRWALAYAASRKGMPTKQEIDAMAQSNHVLPHIVGGIVQLAVLEAQTDGDLLSPAELEGIA